MTTDARPTAVGDRFLAELAAELAGEDSGLGFVYRVLDRVVERYELRDLVAVIESPQVGRQVFRAGRRPFETVAGDRARRLAVLGQRGLHADPSVLDAAVATPLLSLLTLAVRLTLLIHDASHATPTALLIRRV